MRSLFGRLVRPSFLALSCLAASSCERFDGAPEAQIEGLDANGVLAKNEEPLAVRFNRKIDRSTLRLKVAEFATDTEYRLGDEPGVDPSVKFNQLFAYPIQFKPPPDDESPIPKQDALEFLATPEGGETDRLLIKPAENFPVGSQLVLLVEPGLRGENGVETTDRRRLTFSYGFTCKGTEKPGSFTTGKYLFLVQVNKPIGTQIRLYASIRVDPATGAFIGQFTNASRRTDQVCPEGPCPEGKVCRLLPAAACVPPSERAGSLDEFPDFIPNFTPPTGWSFPATGCADEQPDGTIRFGARSDRADVSQPAVSIINISLFGSFKKDDKGTLRANGSFSATEVLLGKISSGAGRGDIVAMRLPDDKAPPNIPDPPASLPK